MKDKAGKEIAVGDLIIYGHALGRCAGLQYGKVLGFGSRKEYGWRDDSRVLETCKVRGVDSDWADVYGPAETRQPRLLKPSTLQFSSRILVVAEDQVHENVRALLREVNP